MENQMGLSHLLNNMDSIGWLTFATLSLMGLLTLWFIIVGTLRNTSIRSRAHRVVRTFWETQNPQEAIRAMEAEPKGEPFSKIALDCANAAAHHAKSEGSRLVEALNRSEFIDRALRQAVSRESGRLEGGLTLLATVGSTAPFVGLFGTVWGIIIALITITAEGDASIEKVAGPVGEALVMTAVGLAVAVPAVIFYNLLGRRNKVIYDSARHFSFDVDKLMASSAKA